jgi:hypothetical protein
MTARSVDLRRIRSHAFNPVPIVWRSVRGRHCSRTSVAGLRRNLPPSRRLARDHRHFRTGHAADRGDELASFTRAIRVANASGNTILAHGGAVRQFWTWLIDRGYSTDVRKIETRHMEEWTASTLERSKPATAHNRFRGLERFFNWCAAVDDDFLSPMRKGKLPRLPRLLPRVLTFEELRAILATCSGRSFEDRLDNALLRVLSTPVPAAARSAACATPLLIRLIAMSTRAATRSASLARAARTTGSR